jgi:oligoendopeptidase F
MMADDQEHTMPAATSAFIPPSFSGADWASIEPLGRELLARPVNSRAELERWIVERGDLQAACAEAEANLYIDMTCDTKNEAKQSAFTTYIETIPPKLKPLIFDLDNRQVELTARFDLDTQRYGVLSRDTRAEVEVFRDENVPIETELEKLSQKYQQIIGAMMVEFEGKEQTLPQMARYQELADREIREAAWRVVADRRLRDVEALNEIYDAMVQMRDQIARNAGFENFIGFTFKAKKRFDYTPADCRTFHTAVEQVIVPFLHRQDQRRKELLGLDKLRPWDLAVDPKGRPPLKPFAGGVDLVNRSRRAFERLDGRLAQMFATLGDGANTQGAANGALLDLDSRKGKAPGGYQSMRDYSRVPFIFMNAAGLHRDVETMVHEAGHAFHSMLCVDEPLLHYRHSPIEFAEVASMSMELLTMPHWGGEGGFYPDAEDLARAQRRQIEGSVGMLPWIATIDAFQHWVYGNPKHTRDQRTSAWLELDSRFGHAVAWDGLEAPRAAMWQRQMHLYGVPFYYIEYGIAQLGSLQLWLRALEESEHTAVEAYMAALRLGGSRPLPELFTTAGLKFDFGPDTIKRLVDRVERELEKLPE